MRCIIRIKKTFIILLDLVTNYWPELAKFNPKFAYMYTINHTQAQNSELFGEVSSPVFKYFKIALTPCVNNTVSQVICKSNEEINKFLSANGLNLITNETYVDLHDPTSPINSYINSNQFYSITPS